MTQAQGQAYFESNYRDYERQSSPRKIAFYLGLLHRWVPPKARVFELGVGLGVFMREACKEYRCQGSDVNAFGVEATREKAPEAEVFEGSAERIPIDPAPAAVVSWDVLEHIADLDRTLATIRARLAPDGILMAVVPAYDGPLGFLVRKLDHDPTHVWKQGRRDWLKQLDAAGFEVVEWGGIIRRLMFSRYYLHITRPQWLLRPTGSALYFVARKRA